MIFAIEMAMLISVSPIFRPQIRRNFSKKNVGWTNMNQQEKGGLSKNGM